MTSDGRMTNKTTAPRIKINLRINGLGTRYFELSINKRIEVEKLIKQNLINADQLEKIERLK